MKDFIKYLERKIEGCDALGGMEREKAIYQSVLKDYKKQCNIGSVSDMFSFGDTVKAKCSATGRYIGKGKCVYISAMTNNRCIDDAIIDCENLYNLPVVSDDELENYR